MASKSYEGNYKAWLLTTEPAGWDPENGSVITQAEIEAGTRLLRLISDGGVTYTYTQNTASQAKLDDGKVGHNIGTREVTGLEIRHEKDFPIASDAMYALYSYGDVRYLIVAPEVDSATGLPADGAQLDGFMIETGEPRGAATARDAKQNFMVGCATQDWDFGAEFEATP